MKEIRAILIRKVIPLIAITGCMGGVTAAVMELAGSPNSYLITGSFILLYAITGTAVGLLADFFFKNRGQDIVRKNHKNELLLVKQPIYFAAGAAGIIAFLINMGAGIGAGLLAAIFYGFTFLLGLSNGIFDYRESVSKNLLMAAILPIGFSFVYGYYINGAEIASNMAWFFGSIYLFSYLLFLNRMQLNSIIFFRKSVNIEDSRKIRVFNDWIIASFYIVYLVMFNFRKLIKVSYDGLLAVIGWIMVLMEKISSWLLIDIKTEAIEEAAEKEELELLPDIKRPWLETLLKVIMYVIVGAVIIAALVSIVVIIIKTIKKIREKLSNNFNRSMSEKKIESKEYEEESQIVKDEENKDNIRSKKKKMQYNLKKLNDIPLAGEKIRYVYGFVLERLYHKHVNIEQSDTPEEILARIKKHRNGDKLAKMGFEEFTEKYRKARYSGKEMEDDDKLAETGGKFEKAVSNIHVDETKSRFE